jgi:hypothetical protein
MQGVFIKMAIIATSPCLPPLEQQTAQDTGKSLLHTSQKIIKIGKEKSKYTTKELNQVKNIPNGGGCPYSF